MLIEKFIYKNIKNSNNNNIFFNLYYNYYLYVIYKKDVDFYCKSKTANNFIAKLSKLTIIYNKSIKPKNFTFSKIFRFNSKYIKIKKN